MQLKEEDFKKLEEYFFAEAETEENELYNIILEIRYGEYKGEAND